MGQAFHDGSAVPQNKKKKNNNNKKNLCFFFFFSLAPIISILVAGVSSDESSLSVAGKSEMSWLWSSLPQSQLLFSPHFGLSFSSCQEPRDPWEPWLSHRTPVSPPFFRGWLGGIIHCLEKKGEEDRGTLTLGGSHLLLDGTLASHWEKNMNPYFCLSEMDPSRFLSLFSHWLHLRRF